MVSTRIPWVLKRGLYPAKWRWDARGAVLMGRHACLGDDVLRVLKPRYRRLNVQKGRIDYMMDCWRDPSQRARSAVVASHIVRSDVVPCILQEEVLYEWMTPRRPLALFMDSMAEHADQRFYHHRERWSFISSYTDVSHSADFARSFDNSGLLSLQSVREHFGGFFECFRTRYGNLPIFYLHFPIKLDARPKFKARAEAIRHVVDCLAARFQPLFSLAVDDSVVDWDGNRTPEMEHFPYHYNQRTYLAFADLVQSTGHWPA